MRTGIYTKIILTVIATMLVAIGLKLYIPSRSATYISVPDAKTLMNQAVEDMTAIAERKDDDGGSWGAGTTGSTAANPVGNKQSTPQNVTQQSLPRRRSEDSAENPRIGEKLAQALSKQLDDDPHSQVARQNSGTIDGSQPPGGDVALPSINLCLGNAVIIRGSPQFKRLDNKPEETIGFGGPGSPRDIENARRGGHPKVPGPSEALPPNSIVAAVLKKPRSSGQLDSRSDFIRSGRDGVGYVLVEVKAESWDKGWVGWMETGVFEQGIHAPGEHTGQ
jgi:hypothetical protein